MFFLPVEYLWNKQVFLACRVSMENIDCLLRITFMHFDASKNGHLA